ncbi:MAG: glycoside hydrolase family 10 protein [Phycisphaerales bacterium]
MARWLMCVLLCLATRAWAQELRGTWLTTTGNDAIAGPDKTASTMRRLRDIGLNTVYVECWKNGYTQYPSKVLQRVIGKDRRPNLVPKDGGAPRDLVRETLDAARANNLRYVAWFEYGFMAAFKETDNELRRTKRDWLSLDQKGNEVAPNGFVWMNPLHPEVQQFLIDLVLECVDAYDLDGVQFDDRIVWPYVTMGYDSYTKEVYAKEHGGREPPADPKDPDWMKWRSDKVREFSRRLVTEVRARKPGLELSLSPAVYPWCYEHYLLDWPEWSAWTTDASGSPRWDEFVPQCYRIGYPQFEQTWIQQVEELKRRSPDRVKDLAAGIRVVGDGPDASWEDVRKSIELVRSSGAKGHVLWFSKGVLDVYPEQLKAFYAQTP